MDTSLLPGERVFWEGRRLRHRMFRKADVLLVPFSLVWFGFVLFWELGALGSESPLYAAAWGLPFVLIGLYVVAGRFVVRAISSRRTRYTLTDARLIIHEGLSGHRVVTAYLRSLPPPVIAEQPDGSGSLAFGSFPGITDAFSRRNGWRAWASEPSTTPVLWDIPHVRNAADFVAHAQR